MIGLFCRASRPSHRRRSVRVWPVALAGAGRSWAGGERLYELRPFRPTAAHNYPTQNGSILLYSALTAAVVLVGPVPLPAGTPASTAGIALSPRSHSGRGTCRSGQLTVDFEPAQSSWAATGSLSFTYRLTNSSRSVCTLRGYPGLQLRPAAGQALPTTDIQQTWPGNPGRQPGEVVVLAGGGHAWFYILYSTMYQGMQCPRSAALDITPPGDTGALVVTGLGGQLQPYGGTQQQGLHCGAIGVSPVRASTFG